VREQAITIMDWYPTLLELCGVPLPKVALDGRSVIGVARDEKASSPHSALHFQWQDDWAVREGDWKLIHLAKRKSRPEADQLFNLADAEPERRDYAADKPELVTRLKELHEGFQKDVSP
jgi:arylsulfatase A-like enzyme